MPAYSPATAAYWRRASSSIGGGAGRPPTLSDARTALSDGSTICQLCGLIACASKIAASRPDTMTSRMCGRGMPTGLSAKYATNAASAPVTGHVWNSGGPATPSSRKRGSIQPCSSVI